MKKRLFVYLIIMRIAAFAYMRRIVENKIAGMLELIQDDAEASGSAKSIIESLSELHNKSPMSDKIKIANTALPEYLKPAGLNPLGKLYETLSEGVHSHTDEECLELANIIQGCIKYLVSELSTRKKNREQFKNLVSKL